MRWSLLVITLGRLGPTEVRDFHQRALRPQHAALVLVGRINPTQARALAEEVLAGWTAEGGAAPEIPPLPLQPAAGAPIYLVSWPGLPQALLLGGRPGHGGGAAERPPGDAD